MPEIVSQDKVFKSPALTIVDKPWGEFIQYVLNEPCTVKTLHVNKKSKLSLQSHKHRAELWLCLRGQCTVTIDNKKIKLTEDNRVFIPQGARHRIETGARHSCLLLEISFGQFDEEDIERFEDEYGRIE